jgi:hypothetical protein
MTFVSVAAVALVAGSSCQRDFSVLQSQRMPEVDDVSA